jgi:hypothetical protein
MEGHSLIIICAWCEAEGKAAFLYQTFDDSSSALDHSHGICKAHRDRLLLELQASLPDSDAVSSRPPRLESFATNPSSP